jgi:ABC-type antimicrobial peptide transport system permease subunit
LRSIDSALPVYQVSTLSDEIDRSLWQERLTAALSALFALFAVIVAGIGIYGILAYFVIQHRRELGCALQSGQRWRISPA